MHSKADLIQRMAEDLAILPSHLENIIRTAPLRYKVFEIPKKSGGSRQVAQPAREVKAIQQWVIKNIGPKLPVHKSATAYSENASILKNAEAHVLSRYMLKLDFEQFFPSILSEDISLHLEQHGSALLDLSAGRLVAHLCCWAPMRKPPLRLCIGAPTSPLFSNSVMYEFDRLLSEMADKDGVTYTRYADDITLSSKVRGKIDGYEELITHLLSELNYPRIKLNAKKTVRASRAGKRTVTGLVITPSDKVSIGRERKRLIRAMYHRSLSQNFDEEQSRVLAGLLAFADSIEPGFSNRLIASVKPHKTSGSS